MVAPRLTLRLSVQPIRSVETEEEVTDDIIIKNDSKVSDSSSDAFLSPSLKNSGKKKKAGVKINIPNFGGKHANPQDAASAFWDWARIINHYREYYEDEYLMTQVAGSLKNDAARVFDWVRHNHCRTGDLGLIFQKMRNHYSATLTFREQ